MRRGDGSAIRVSPRALRIRARQAVLACSAGCLFATGCNAAATDECDERNLDAVTNVEAGGETVEAMLETNENWIGEWWREIYDPTLFEDSARLIATARCSCWDLRDWPEPWRWGDDEDSDQACVAELERENWLLQVPADQLARYEADNERRYALACITLEYQAVADCFQDGRGAGFCDYDTHLVCLAELDSIGERCGGYRW